MVGAGKPLAYDVGSCFHRRVVGLHADGTADYAVIHLVNTHLGHVGGAWLAAVFAGVQEVVMVVDIEVAACLDLFEFRGRLACRIDFFWLALNRLDGLPDVQIRLLRHLNRFFFAINSFNFKCA